MLNNQVQSLKLKLAEVSLGRTVVHFLDYLTVEAGLSANTLLAYGRDLMGFCAYCEGKGVKSLDGITAITVYGYLQENAQSGLGENSLSRCLVAIKMLLRFGLMTGKSGDDFTDSLEGRNYGSGCRAWSAVSRFLDCWKLRHRRIRIICATVRCCFCCMRLGRGPARSWG